MWDEPTLVSFLIVFLLYVTYYPLRYSIEDPQRRARYASVFAITAGAFVPINFIAVRLAESLVHPRVLNQTAGDMPGEMRLTFLVALAGMALLYVTLVKLELTSKHARAPAAPAAQAARGGASGRRGASSDRHGPGEAGLVAMPALPLDEAGKYVAGAYGVFVALILIYVAIMGARLQRIEREIQSLTELARASGSTGAHADGARCATPRRRTERSPRRWSRAGASAAGAGTRVPTTRRSWTSPAARRSSSERGKVGEGKIEGLLSARRQRARRVAHRHRHGARLGGGGADRAASCARTRAPTSTAPSS